MTDDWRKMYYALSENKQDVICAPDKSDLVEWTYYHFRYIDAATAHVAIRSAEYVVVIGGNVPKWIAGLTKGWAERRQDGNAYFDRAHGIGNGRSAA